MFRASIDVLLVVFFMMIGCKSSPVHEQEVSSILQRSALEQCRGIEAEEVQSLLESHGYKNLRTSEQNGLTSEELSNLDDKFIIRPESPSQITSVLRAESVENRGDFVTYRWNLGFYFNHEGKVVGVTEQCSGYGF